MVWQLLAKPLLGVVSDGVKSFAETKKAKAEQKVLEIKAKSSLMEKKIKGEIDWDIEAIKGSKDSWKDEWILVLWSIPMIMIWIPPLQIYVESGFNALKNNVPDWYFWTWGAIVSASYGIKGATKFFKR
tara:strand:- start:46 stop:432 length:387 start_codon:yes stop_codon:yes gene_type:complete